MGRSFSLCALVLIGSSLFECGDEKEKRENQLSNVDSGYLNLQEKKNDRCSLTELPTVVTLNDCELRTLTLNGKMNCPDIYASDVEHEIYLTDKNKAITTLFLPREKDDIEKRFNVYDIVKIGLVGLSDSRAKCTPFCVFRVNEEYALFEWSRNENPYSITLFSGPIERYLNERYSNATIVSCDSKYSEKPK